MTKEIMAAIGLGVIGSMVSFVIGFIMGSNSWERIAVREGAGEYYLDDNYEKCFRFRKVPHD